MDVRVHRHVIAGIVIVLTGFTRTDAIASLVVVVLMLRAAWGLLTDSGRILLEGTPERIDLADIRSHLCEEGHVLDVHDLHVWTVTSDLWRSPGSDGVDVVLMASGFALDGRMGDPIVLGQQRRDPVEDRVQVCAVG